MYDPLTPAEAWCQKCDQPAVHGHHGVPCYDGDTQRSRCLSCGGAPFHEYIAYCVKHDPRPEAALLHAAAAVRYVPDAITDPWLRIQFAQATGAINRPLR